MIDTEETRTQEWPARELGNFTGRRESEFQVVFKQSVLDQIHLHGQSAAEIEVCGVLVGEVYQDARGPYLLIDHCVPGSGAESKSSAVTFTAETWQHIHETMDRDYPDKKIAGWYHTHPSFGIFLSDMDVFICDHFFNLPWQVAFVYDPQSGEEGSFIWRQGKPTREAVLVENDVTPLATKIPLISKADAMVEIPAPPTPPPFVPVKLRDTAAEQIIELRYRVRRLEKRQQLFFIALAFVVAFVAFIAVGVPPGLQSMTGPRTSPPPASQPVRQSVEKLKP